MRKEQRSYRLPDTISVYRERYITCLKQGILATTAPPELSLPPSSKAAFETSLT